MTYADECLERARKLRNGPWRDVLDVNVVGSNIADFVSHARTDVEELACRLRIACEGLRRAAYAIDGEDYASIFNNLADDLESPIE